MAMTNAEKVARSDAKRGIMAKTYKLPQTLVAEIDRLSVELGISKGKVLEQAVELLAQSTKGA